MKVLMAVAGLALICACGPKQVAPSLPAPSRAAGAGCEWTALEAKAAGVALLVEKCAQPKYSFEPTPMGVTMKRLSDGATQTIVAALSKRSIQPVAGAIRDQFISGLSDNQRMGCSAEPVKQAQVEGLQVLEIRPAGNYVAEAKQLVAADATARPCGAYGEGDGSIVFIGQPEVTRTRFAMVHARQEQGPWDEKSVRLLPDSVADEALAGTPVNSLTVAERLAGVIESRLDGYDKKSGQIPMGDANITWTVFYSKSRPVMLVETQDGGDSGSGSLRSFFRDGKLFLQRQSLLRPPAKPKEGKSHKSMESWLLAMAFDANGKPVEGRKTIEGKAVPLEDGDWSAASTRATELLRRAQESK